MRIHVTVAIFLLLPQLATPAVSPERSGRAHFAKKTFGKKAVAEVGAGTLIAHARNSPPEWGRGAPGLGKRFASGLGKHAVGSSINFTVSKLRHEALGYQPSGKQGFAPRLKYALVSTVVTRKTTTGKRTVASGRLSGAVGSGFISRLWMPARMHSIASGASSAGISLGVDAGSNVVREFWPEIRHPRGSTTRAR